MPQIFQPSTPIQARLLAMVMLLVGYVIGVLFGLFVPTPDPWWQPRAVAMGLVLGYITAVVPAWLYPRPDLIQRAFLQVAIGHAVVTLAVIPGFFIAAAIFWAIESVFALPPGSLTTRSVIIISLVISTIGSGAVMWRWLMPRRPCSAV